MAEIIIKLCIFIFLSSTNPSVFTTYPMVGNDSFEKNSRSENLTDYLLLPKQYFYLVFLNIILI
ncbi:MAG: hypothetical protein COW65_01530 [Cytophagales bacterium CG18_big_fil_WC_8_21_14_2_50_42_9]|nr:MAG: hypothetical protein COW65_01530 [Cytophagales bacterium CG18_big_fil_WC_8_21_14_2_50_42_9]